jgi:hypothetical protein
LRRSGHIDGRQSFGRAAWGVQKIRRAHGPFRPDRGSWACGLGGYRWCANFRRAAAIQRKDAGERLAAIGRTYGVNKATIASIARTAHG